jgi:hypothetical protein
MHLSQHGVVLHGFPSTALTQAITKSSHAANTESNRKERLFSGVAGPGFGAASLFSGAGSFAEAECGRVLAASSSLWPISRLVSLVSDMAAVNENERHYSISGCGDAMQP